MSNALPTEASLADINHAMQSAAESDLHHEDMHSAVVGGDFSDPFSQDFIPDRQIAQLRISPHPIEAKSSVLGGLLRDNGAWGMGQGRGFA